MMKKLLCLALALVMLGMSSMAMATSSGDPHMWYDEDVYFAVDTESSQTDGMKALATIYDYIRGGGSVGAYFGVEGSWILAELVEIKLASISSGMNDFYFPTKFADGAIIKAMFGIINGSKVTWIELKATVVNGVVKVNFTKDALAKAAGKQTLLAILM